MASPADLKHNTQQNFSSLSEANSWIMHHNIGVLSLHTHTAWLNSSLFGRHELNTAGSSGSALKF
jgi:hypothetical protein